MAAVAGGRRTMTTNPSPWWRSWGARRPARQPADEADAAAEDADADHAPTHADDPAASGDEAADATPCPVCAAAQPSPSGATPSARIGSAQGTPSAAPPCARSSPRRDTTARRPGPPPRAATAALRPRGRAHQTEHGTMKKPPAASVCWHEAGHGVAAYTLGGLLTYISARPDPDHRLWGGVCSWKQGDTDPPADDILIAFAGPLAERRYRDLTPSASARPISTDHSSASGRPASWRDGATIAMKIDVLDLDPGDTRVITDGVRTLAKSSPIAPGLIEERLRRRTQRLIRSHRGTHLIEALALALYRSGELTGEAATSILRRADQQLVEWQQATTSSPAMWGEEDDDDPLVATTGMVADADTSFLEALAQTPALVFCKKNRTKSAWSSQKVACRW